MGFCDLPLISSTPICTLFNSRDGLLSFAIIVLGVIIFLVMWGVGYNSLTNTAILSIITIGIAYLSYKYKYADIILGPVTEFPLPEILLPETTPIEE